MISSACEDVQPFERGASSANQITRMPDPHRQLSTRARNDTVQRPSPSRIVLPWPTAAILSLLELTRSKQPLINRKPVPKFSRARSFPCEIAAFTRLSPGSLCAYFEWVRRVPDQPAKEERWVFKRISERDAVDVTGAGGRSSSSSNSNSTSVCSRGDHASRSPSDQQRTGSW